MNGRNGVVAVLVTGLALGGCSAKQVAVENTEAARFAYQQRVDQLEILTTWDLSGKLSLDDSEDGGSGKLNWKVRDSESLMDFRGALGKGAWRLSSGPGHAELLRADGSSVRAGSVVDLVAAEIGWQVPVDSLKWWVLGIAAPGETDWMDLDNEGRVVAMQQEGWNISFQRYRQFGELELPARMDAVRGRYRVKLAVASWIVHEPGSDDD